MSRIVRIMVRLLKILSVSAGAIVGYVIVGVVLVAIAVGFVFLFRSFE